MIVFRSQGGHLPLVARWPRRGGEDDLPERSNRAVIRIECDSEAGAKRLVEQRTAARAHRRDRPQYPCRGFRDLLGQTASHCDRIGPAPRKPLLLFVLLLSREIRCAAFGDQVAASCSETKVCTAHREVDCSMTTTVAPRPRARAGGWLRR